METQLDDSTQNTIADTTGEAVTGRSNLINYVVIAALFLVAGIAIGMIISSTISSDNEVLIAQAVDAAYSRQENMIVQSIEAALAGQESVIQGGTNPVTIVGADDDPAIGPEDAPVVMIEFSDFNCPYCGRFATQTLHPLLEAYEGQLRFVYRDFPILGPSSTEAALASECADDQDAYWDYHDLLFENQSSRSTEGFIQFATDLQLDVDQFTTCLEEQIHLDEVTADYEDARQSGAQGTPAFIINGQFVSGAQPIEVFAAIIDQELAAAQTDGSN